MCDSLDVEEMKGFINFPCCRDQKIMVKASSHGAISCRCPRCHRFTIFDLDKMASCPGRAARGAVRKFNTSHTD